MLSRLSVRAERGQMGLKIMLYADSPKLFLLAPEPIPRLDSHGLPFEALAAIHTTLACPPLTARCNSSRAKGTPLGEVLQFSRRHALTHSRGD